MENIHRVSNFFEDGQLKYLFVELCLKATHNNTLYVNIQSLKSRARLPIEFEMIEMENVYFLGQAAPCVLFLFGQRWLYMLS